MALNSYSEAPSKLVTAHVFRQEGGLLGNIQGIDRAPGGIAGVRIEVAGPMVITLPASEVSYDAAKNIVVTDERATKAALGVP